MHRTPCRPCRQSACDDVLESIALQEAAIAHILNAEGEKLQKSTEISTSISELLEVNASVQETLWYAAFLERVLSDKLNTLQGMCCCVPGGIQTRESKQGGGQSRDDAGGRMDPHHLRGRSNRPDAV